MKDFLKFLGTAGARFVVIRQLRASGGLWISLGSTQILVDPGPGSLVRGLKSRPPLDPRKLDGIFLSHRHLDHSADMNIMVEAMTDGGFDPRGTVLAPADALEGEPVLFSHLRKYLRELFILREKETFQIRNVRLEIPVRNVHSVETYGFMARCPGYPVVSYVPDTRFFPELADAYRGSEILIVNTVLLEGKTGIDHLCLAEAEEIIRNVRPRRAYLTHFGMTMLRGRIWEQMPEVSRRTGVPVEAADDGMTVRLDDA